MKCLMVMLMLTSFVLSTWAEVFRDDFNDENLEGWVVLRAREASIENGELVLGFPHLRIQRIFASVFWEWSQKTMR